MMKLFRPLLLGSVSLAIMAAPVMAQDNPLADFKPVTDEMLQNPDPNDWLSWRRTLDNQGYSPLDQINRENVGKLRAVWSRAMTDGYQEAAPLVYDGVMYVPHPRDVIQALDATTGDLLWEYKRELPDNIPFIVTTRNIAIAEDKVVFSSKDNYVVALDAKTGQLAWETQVRDQDSWFWSTPGPIIANGKVISGRSCAQEAAASFAGEGESGPEACFLSAHDLATGEELWRFNTIPVDDAPGADTWGGVPNELRHHVGSWIAPAFDPELNLVYFGTSVSSPYSKFYFAEFDDVADLEQQEFLYQTSTLAINADTGELVWYQQHIRDHWDLDHPFERILVDTVAAPDPSEVKWISPNIVAGKEYKVLTGIPGKTGIFYSIDRETGEFLWARETTYQNVITDIDTTTGRASHPLDMIPTEVGQALTVCPSDAGGKRWYTSAYSPLTKAIYEPLANICMRSVTLPNDIRLSPYQLSPGTDVVGRVSAINVETGKELWRRETEMFTTSLLATGGGLVFGGDMDRRFRAFDQWTGDVLWETIVSAQVGGVPITYAVDGVQYVAVPVGSWLASESYYDLSPNLKPVTGGNAVVVFALSED